MSFLMNGLKFIVRSLIDGWYLTVDFVLHLYNLYLG